MSQEQGHPGVEIPVMPNLKSKQAVKNLKDVHNILFVMSGKGGVGKSSVTVNLAAALADMGKRVGILDVDLHGPSVPRLLGTTEGVFVGGENRLLPVPCGKNLSFISVDALLQDRDNAVIWRGPMKNGVILQFIADVEWGVLDYLIIDSPPGTGDEHMTVLDTLPDAKSLVVTTPQEISLADVRKALSFLHEEKAPILGIVENMSGLICPHCGKEIDLFKKGGGQKLAEAYKIPFLGAIPIDPATVVAADMGLPCVRLPHPSPAKDAFLALAKKVLELTM